MKTLKKIQLKIDSILGGHGPTWYLSGKNQYLDSVAIDPEARFDSDTYRAMGGINPMGAETALTGSSMPDTPMWIMAAQTTTGVYVYTANGTIYTLGSFGSSVDEDGGLCKATGGVGNGAVVYSDYLYVSTATGVGRLGPLSTTTPRYEDVWASAGHFSMAALTNNSSKYPGVNSVNYPNHVMHVHNDGYVYIADYTNGQGYIHSFYCSGGADTLSVWGDLALPPGLIPTDIKSYGTDLAILCSPEALYPNGAIPIPGKSAMILWDTISDSFYRNVPISEPVATAMVSKNGELFVLSGGMGRGVKLAKYLGGYSFKDLTQYEEGSPPPASAADSTGDMVVWGVYGTIPTTYAGVMSYGYRRGSLGGRARNTIMRVANTTDTLPMVSAMKFVLPSQFPFPTIGWRTDTTARFGIDTATSGPSAFGSIFRGPVFNIGKSFAIRTISIPLGTPVAAGTTIYPKIYLDGESSSYELPTIDATNFPGSEQNIDFTNLSITGDHDFYIQFTWAGTAKTGIAPGVTFDVDVYE